MAQRRMVSLKVIDTDQFLDMPLSTQALYFHLITRADDDGFFANPKKIMRMINCSDDDLKVLMTKEFVIPFDGGVCVIKHWKIHNLIRGDRYTETIYKTEKNLLIEDHNKVYNTAPINVIPDDTQMEPQVSLVKDSIVKDSINNNSPNKNESALKEFEKWYENYPKHEARKNAEKKYISMYKAKKLPPLSQHIEIINKWKESGRWDDKQFIPLPASWLNAERWSDDIPDKYYGKPKKKTALDYLAEIDAEESMKDMFAGNEELI